MFPAPMSRLFLPDAALRIEFVLLNVLASMAVGVPVDPASAPDREDVAAIEQVACEMVGTGHDRHDDIVAEGTAVNFHLDDLVVAAKHILDALECACLTLLHFLPPCLRSS